MNRKKLLQKSFQRSHLLTLKNSFYRKWIEKFIIDEIKGDIGMGDITTNSVIHQNKKAKAIVIAKENGIVAGIEEATLLYRKHGIMVKPLKKDGNPVKKGDKVLLLTGKAKNLLKIERSAVDLLQRMSGIATLTNSLIKKIKNKVAIAPTRKTQWRYLDKKAVALGKGLTHRLALWESLLIKNNHLAALKNEKVKDVIATALERAWRKRKQSIFIEIEVANEREAVTAAKKFKQLQGNDKIPDKKPCFIMFDNMKPRQVKKAMNKLKKLNLYGHVLLEASGGINPKNIVQYSKTGVDVLSLGYLTHSSKALNMEQLLLD